MSERLVADARVRPAPAARAVVQLVLLVAAAAVALRLPELLAVAAPFVLGLAVDLTAPRMRRVVVEVEVPAARVLEGDDVTVGVTVTAPGVRVAAARVRVTTSVQLVGPDGRVLTRDVGLGERTPLTVGARRWGLAGVDAVEVAWRSPLGLLAATAVVRPRARTLRVLPTTRRLRELVAPRTPGAWAGARPSGVAGRGVEYADLRPFGAGDLARDVNWRVTARRGEPWVTVRRPERSTDVVLLLDAFAPRALDEVVRTAAGIVEAHLVDRDRVGVLGLSGILRWVRPGAGDRHRHRLLDLLLRTQVIESWATSGLATVPRAALPPGALVIAVTLLGPRMVDAVADLCARQRDVLVLDLRPAPTTGSRPDRLDDLAARLVQLERRHDRDELRRLGATVVDVAAAGGLGQALAFATRARRARAVAR